MTTKTTTTTTTTKSTYSAARCENCQKFMKGGTAATICNHCGTPVGHNEPPAKPARKSAKPAAAAAPQPVAEQPKRAWRGPARCATCNHYIGKADHTCRHCQSPTPLGIEVARVEAEVRAQAEATAKRQQEDAAVKTARKATKKGSRKAAPVASTQETQPVTEPTQPTAPAPTPAPAPQNAKRGHPMKRIELALKAIRPEDRTEEVQKALALLDDGYEAVGGRFGKYLSPAGEETFRTRVDISQHTWVTLFQSGILQVIHSNDPLYGARTGLSYTLKDAVDL